MQNERNCGNVVVWYIDWFYFTSQVQTGSWPSYMKAKDRICQNPNEQQHRQYYQRSGVLCEREYWEEKEHVKIGFHNGRVVAISSRLLYIPQKLKQAGITSYPRHQNRVGRTTESTFSQWCHAGDSNCCRLTKPLSAFVTSTKSFLGFPVKRQRLLGVR